MNRIIGLLILVVISACKKEVEITDAPQIYAGPLSKLTGATIIHSDSGLLKAKVKAEEILDLQNGDRELPKGMFITFYEKDGTISATLRANFAYYYKEEDRWKAVGNVVVHNLVNEETLKSEELYWEPKSEDVYTEKFVRIETPGELMTGTGLKAKQDFSEWTLDDPEGIIDIEDNGGI